MLEPQSCAFTSTAAASCKFHDVRPHLTYFYRQLANQGWEDDQVSELFSQTDY